jgi:hypothetical protein
MVGADPFFDTRRDKLTGLALRHKLPTMFQFREYTEAGGLMSYGINGATRDVRFGPIADMAIIRLPRRQRRAAFPEFGCRVLSRF